MPLDVYYNEVDPHAAQTLRNLIAAGELPFGVVDERDIRDVQPSNLDGFAQCHFFAGVGIWAKALQIAGVRHDKQIWTGSCPCQPLSAAGKGLGFEDERHLWPDWHWLIDQCRPETILGEQVASHDGLKWADLVQADLEATDYAFGPVDTCAAGFGGYHIRQRLYFAGIDIRVANPAGQPGRLADGREWQQMLEDIWRGAAGGMEYSERTRLEGHGRHGDNRPEPGRLTARPARPAATASPASGLDNTGCIRRDARGHRDHRGDDRQQPDADVASRGMGHAASPRPLSSPQPGLHRREESTGPRHAEPERSGGDCSGMAAADRGKRNRVASGEERQRDRAPSGRNKSNSQPERSFETDHARTPDIHGAGADWLFCRDGKWRPVRPGSFPLADAYPGRVGELRAYGNALDLGQATAFVHAFMERPLELASSIPAGDLFEWGT